MPKQQELPFIYALTEFQYQKISLVHSKKCCIQNFNASFKYSIEQKEATKFTQGSCSSNTLVPISKNVIPPDCFRAGGKLSNIKSKTH